MISSPSQSSVGTLLSGSSATISSNVHLRSACFRAESLAFAAITAQINCQMNRGSSIRLPGLSVNQPLCQPVVRINPPVAQERPVRARGIELSEVNRHDENLFPVRAGLGEDFAGGTGNETLSPKLDARASRGTLVADAIGDSDVAAIGQGVAALDELPRLVLVGAVCRFFTRMPADGGRVEKNLRALQCRQLRALWILLVLANQHADLAVAGLPRAETQIAGREIKLLVVERIVRDVHLPVRAEQRTVRINDGGRVVIDAGRAPLEERGDDDHLVFAGELLKDVRARAGNRLGEFEILVVFGL